MKFDAQQGFEPSQRVLSTPKKSEIDDFDAFEAVFAKNYGTKLVLNCEININNARFPY